MDDSTIQTLNELNRSFYQSFATQFDDTRQSPWPGWNRVLGCLDLLQGGAAVARVLDIGCGNGRFYAFLQSHWRTEFEYLGLDACPALLERAPRSVRAKFDHKDVLVDGLPSGEFSLVTAFGFFHHVPSHELRRTLLRQMIDRLQPGGLVAVAFWAFAGKARFTVKTLEWPESLQREDGDYLLSWDRGGHGQRYCHDVSEEEEAQLLQGLEVKIVDRFFADGKSGDLNRYLVLQR